MLTFPALPNSNLAFMWYFRAYWPEPLRDVVDAIWDWDIADGEAARTMRIHPAPSTRLLLMAQYRAPVELLQNGSSLPVKCATQIRGSPVVLQPGGPLGMIIVSLKPDAAGRIVGQPLGHFANANLSLPDLFGQNEAAESSELLAAARTSAERFNMVFGVRSRMVDGLSAQSLAYPDSP